MPHRSYLLDTSALFCLRDNENGADKVESIFNDVNKGHADAFISFMSIMEYLYISQIEMGKEYSRMSYAKLALLPLKLVESSQDISFIAADLKANHKISVADAWIAATAYKTNSVLVHKDPELESIKEIEQLILPYKKS